MNPLAFGPPKDQISFSHFVNEKEEYPFLGYSSPNMGTIIDTYSIILFALESFQPLAFWLKPLEKLLWNLL